MKIIPPIVITDGIMTSSNVEDVAYVAPVYASGMMTVTTACNHVHASGQITVSSEPVVNETFVIGAQIFTFKDSGTATGDVIRNADNNNQAENIKISVNRDIAAMVGAARSGSVVTITAVSEVASVGNAIDFTENATGIAVDGSGHLFGGISDSPTLGETFIVHDQTFTIVAAGAATGEVVRDITSVTNQAHQIDLSINRDLVGVVTSTHNAGVITIIADIIGTEGNEIVLTEALTGTTVSGSGTFTGGINEVLGNVEWSVATDYAVGAEVVITATHTLYESLKTPNLNKPPADYLTGDDPYWLELGKTNRWKMFDTMSTSQTSNPTSIIVILTPGISINSATTLNINATSVNFLMVSGGVTRYNQTVYPASTASTNVIKTDLPSYPAATLTVTIANTDDNATCGFLIIGTSQDLGTTRPKPIVRLIDYSGKTTDTFGNYTITERAYSRRIECEIMTAIASLGTLKQTLAQYRATPLLWIASELYSIMILYGFCKEFSISLPDYTLASTDLTIEGLI